MDISTIGLDLAKSVFQVHVLMGRVGCDAQDTAPGAGAAVLRQAAALPCRHGGVRHIASLGARDLKLGHEVRLMPPAYVKPYVKRGKNDAVDAEAICEAVTRPTMRFVAVKSLSSRRRCRFTARAICWSSSARSW